MDVLYGDDLLVLASEVGEHVLGEFHYPFRLDPFWALLGRAPAFRAAFSEISAGFAESRRETASSKARR